MIARLVALVRERWLAATDRERAALAVLAVVVAAFAALAAADAALAAREREFAARERRLGLEAVLAHTNQTFQGQIAAEANKVWTWSVAQSDPTLAQAETAAIAEALAIEAGLANAEVVSGEVTEGSARVGAALVRIRCDFDWSSFLRFLAALESSERSFVMEAIEVSPPNDGQARMSIVLSATFVREPAS